MTNHSKTFIKKYFELAKRNDKMPKALYKWKPCVVTLIMLSFNVILRTGTVVPLLTKKYIEVEKG